MGFSSFPPCLPCFMCHLSLKKCQRAPDHIGLWIVFVPARLLLAGQPWGSDVLFLERLSSLSRLHLQLGGSSCPTNWVARGSRRDASKGQMSAQHYPCSKSVLFSDVANEMGLPTLQLLHCWWCSRASMKHICPFSPPVPTFTHGACTKMPSMGATPDPSSAGCCPPGFLSQYIWFPPTNSSANSIWGCTGRDRGDAGPCSVPCHPSCAHALHPDWRCWSTRRCMAHILLQHLQHRWQTVLPLHSGYWNIGHSPTYSRVCLK